MIPTLSVRCSITFWPIQYAKTKLQCRGLCTSVLSNLMIESFTVPGKQRRCNGDSQNIYSRTEQLVGTRMGNICKVPWWTLVTFGNPCWGLMRVLFESAVVTFGNTCGDPCGYLREILTLVGDQVTSGYLWLAILTSCVANHIQLYHSVPTVALLLSAALVQ